MKQPEFPKGFYNYCGLYQEAKHWAKILESPLKIVPEDWAQCDFENRGYGIECQQCQKFMSEVKGNNIELIFVPKIKEYYELLKKYEKYKEEADLNMGAGI